MKSSAISNKVADRLVCPTGSYCEASSHSGTLCPTGTFSNSDGRTSLDACQNCPSGFYCPELGMTSGINSGYKCSAGYFCETKAKVTNPNLVNDDFDGLCPVGYYCPEGASEKMPCPAGTFGSVAGLESVQECTDCPGGYFCDREALAWDDISDGINLKEGSQFKDYIISTNRPPVPPSRVGWSLGSFKKEF